LACGKLHVLLVTKVLYTSFKCAKTKQDNSYN